MSKSLVPRIRFKGFTDPWEQQKLSAIVDRYDNLRIPISENLRVPGKTPYFGANGIQGFIKGYTHDGEFVLVAEDGAQNLKDYPIKYVRGQIWVNNHAHVVAGKSGIIFNAFLSYSLKTINFESIVVGSSRVKLNSFDLMNIPLNMTSSLIEQKSIQNLFSYLDRLITLHQRKCDLLKNLKKSLLEKLFPKNNTNIPEIRFKGFTDAWEQEKLSKFVFRTSTIGFSSSKTPSIEYEDLESETGKIINNIYKKKTSKKGIQFHSGDILFGKLRPYLKNWMLASFSGVAVGDFWVLSPNSHDSEFIYSLIQTPKFFEISNISSGSKMPRSDWTLVANTKFWIPKTKLEGLNLGNIFTKIDLLITLHQRKLEKLKNIKKSLLEKMFV